MGDAAQWLQARFAGLPPTNTCALVGPGSSIAPTS
jgi:hypothetical protein